MNRYSMSPFSGPRFKENEMKLKERQTPCAICGKAVAYPYKHEVTVVDGGSDWAMTKAEEENESDSGYMGAWGIGPDCHKKYLIKPEVKA